MAKVPNKIEKIKTLEDDLSTSVATALWKKAANLCEYINKSRPIGMVMFFNDTQTLLPAMPDPKYWKECDGTAVSNANSPLNGVVIPEMRFRYFKHPSDGAVVFVAAGSDTANFAHNHGGSTGAVFPTDGFTADDDDEVAGPFYHAHPISTSLGVVDIKPPYKEFRVYMRIV